MLENRDSQSCFFENPWFGPKKTSIFTQHFSQQKTSLTNIETIVWPHIQWQDGRVGAMPRTMQRQKVAVQQYNQSKIRKIMRTQPTKVCVFFAFVPLSLYIVYSIQQYMLYNYIYIVI